MSTVITIYYSDNMIHISKSGPYVNHIAIVDMAQNDTYECTLQLYWRLYLAPTMYKSNKYMRF